jgi:hypothetical protein
MTTTTETALTEPRAVVRASQARVVEARAVLPVATV